MRRALRNAQPPSMRRSTPQCSRRRWPVRVSAQSWKSSASGRSRTGDSMPQERSSLRQEGKNGHYGPQLPHISSWREPPGPGRP